MYVYVCLCEFVCTGYVKEHMEVRGVRAPETGVPGVCEPLSENYGS